MGTQFERGVERARAMAEEAIRVARNASYDEGVEDSSEIPEPGARERARKYADATETEAIAAALAYGVACYAQGRAEAEKAAKS